MKKRKLVIVIVRLFNDISIGYLINCHSKKEAIDIVKEFFYRANVNRKLNSYNTIYIDGVHNKITKIIPIINTFNVRLPEQDNIMAVTNACRTDMDVIKAMDRKMKLMFNNWLFLYGEVNASKHSLYKSYKQTKKK